MELTTIKRFSFVQWVIYYRLNVRKNKYGNDENEEKRQLCIECLSKTGWFLGEDERKILKIIVCRKCGDAEKYNAYKSIYEEQYLLETDLLCKLVKNGFVK